MAPPRLLLGSLCLSLLALAVRADSPEIVAQNEAGIAHLHDGRPADAVASFEQALEAQPQSRLLKRNLAAALAALAEKRRDTREALGAIDLLDRAAQLHPERLRYRVLLGRVRVEGGRDSGRQLAREDFTFVLERDPDHLDSLVNLGQLDYMERRLDQHNGLLRGGARRTRADRPWRIGKRYGPYELRGDALRAERAVKKLRGARRLEWKV